MGRHVTSVSELIPFLQKTGQMHLLDELKEGGGKPPKRLNLAVSPPSGGSDSPQGGQKGKKRKKMTGVEAEFARILDIRKERGHILHWLYEPITLRWGVLDVLKYTPDFVIFDSIEIEEGSAPALKMRLVEVKGPYIHNESRAMRTFKEARNHWHGVFLFQLHQKTKEEGWQQIY